MPSKIKREAVWSLGESLFWLVVILFVASSLPGCDEVTIGASDRNVDDGPPPPYVHGTCPYPAGPPMDLPAELRQGNYAGGSCMHAALISVLRWQGKQEVAAWWRGNYAGAAGVWDLARICRARDFRFAWTTKGDAGFLQWCSDTRRGAAIHYFSGHAITFCGYVDGKAVLLDNNRPRTYIYVPKERFIRAWRGYGGYALTVVYSPTPPKPWRSS